MPFTCLISSFSFDLNSFLDVPTVKSFYALDYTCGSGEELNPGVEPGKALVWLRVLEAILHERNDLV